MHLAIPYPFPFPCSIPARLRRQAWGWSLCLAAVGLSLHGPAWAGATCPPSPQALTPALFQQAAAQAQDRGFLWRIRKEGRTSYLYGTLHVGRAEWMAPGPLTQQALAATEVTGLELDPLDPGLQQEMASANVQAPQDRPLPKALQERLRRDWLAECLSEAELGQAPAELQALSLTFMVGRRDGLQVVYGTDILLALLAHGRGREVVSLETGAAQLAALLEPQAADAQQGVRETLEEVEQGRARQLLLKVADVWARGDLEALEHYGDWCDCLKTAQDRAQLKRLMDDRNPGMAERIDAVHRGGQAIFAAVGALHMVGPTGLPALLAQRGYQVERVR